MIVFRGQHLRFCLDRHTGRLWRGQEGTGQPIHLPPKQWYLLEHLAENPGRLISKTELADNVWKGITVTDASISKAVSELRRALSDENPDHSLFIETAHGRGIRFVAEIERDVEESIHNANALSAESSTPAGPTSQYGERDLAEWASDALDSLTIGLDTATIRMWQERLKRILQSGNRLAILTCTSSIEVAEDISIGTSRATTLLDEGDGV